MKSISFKIEEPMLQKLDSYAIKHNMNRSEAIRKAIELLLKEESQNETFQIAKVEKIKLW